MELNNGHINIDCYKIQDLFPLFSNIDSVWGLGIDFFGGLGERFLRFLLLSLSSSLEEDRSFLFLPLSELSIVGKPGKLGGYGEPRTAVAGKDGGRA